MVWIVLLFLTFARWANGSRVEGEADTARAREKNEKKKTFERGEKNSQNDAERLEEQRQALEEYLAMSHADRGDGPHGKGMVGVTVTNCDASDTGGHTSSTSSPASTSKLPDYARRYSGAWAVNSEWFSHGFDDREYTDDSDDDYDDLIVRYRGHFDPKYYHPEALPSSSANSEEPRYTMRGSCICT